MKSPFWKVIGFIVLGGIVLFGVIQFIPYGRDHTNPPVVKEPNWDSGQTRALAVRACFDCHSNETVWPWYSNIAPISWLTQNDVDEGRQRLNFSDITTLRERESRMGDIVLEGEMPPLQYFPTHPNARLTASERQALADGLNATFGGMVGQSGDGNKAED